MKIAIRPQGLPLTLQKLTECFWRVLNGHWQSNLLQSISLGSSKTINVNYQEEMGCLYKEIQPLKCHGKHVRNCQYLLAQEQGNLEDEHQDLISFLALWQKIGIS